MIGGPRLCEPLLATGLGRFTGGACEKARYPRKRVWTLGMIRKSVKRFSSRQTRSVCTEIMPKQEAKTR